MFCRDVHLPDNTKCAIANGAIWLHLSWAWHLTSWVAVRLRHSSPAAGASSKRCGVARRPRRGCRSGQTRCSAEARGGSSRGGVDAEILVAQLGARKQVATHCLSACTMECHPLSNPDSPLCLRASPSYC